MRPLFKMLAFFLILTVFVSSVGAATCSTCTKTCSGGSCAKTVTPCTSCKCAPNFTFPANPGRTVKFTDKTPCKVNVWRWNFGDGTRSSVQNPLKTFKPGTYSVCLSVGTKQPNGKVCWCPTAICKRITIK